MPRRSRRSAAPGTKEELGMTKTERHKRKPKGWRGDAARHSEAGKRAAEKRQRNAAKKAAMTRPPKKQAIKDAKKEHRRKRGMPEGEGK